jgi:hypothetical protein
VLLVLAPGVLGVVGVRGAGVDIGVGEATCPDAGEVMNPISTAVPRMYAAARTAARSAMFSTSTAERAVGSTRRAGIL